LLWQGHLDYNYNHHFLLNVVIKCCYLLSKTVLIYVCFFCQKWSCCMSRKTFEALDMETFPDKFNKTGVSTIKFLESNFYLNHKSFYEKRWCFKGKKVNFHFFPTRHLSISLEYKFKLITSKSLWEYEINQGEKWWQVAMRTTPKLKHS